MTRTHRNGLARFMDEYHQRSIIEAVFGAIKKMYGNHLRGRKLVRQNREVAIRIICYNIEVVARSHVKSGRLTHDSLTAMPHNRRGDRRAAHGGACAPPLGSDGILRFRTAFEAGDVGKIPQSQEFG